MREKRLDLYIVRVIACLMVIMTHVSANPMVAGVYPHTFYKLMNASSKFCVPLFVFLSGFLLEYHYEARTNRGRYYLKILKRLVFPYLFWLSVYYSYFIFRGMYHFNLKQLIVGVLTGNIIFHLYYMLISIQLYLLYPFIRKIANIAGCFPLIVIGLIGARYSGKIPFLQSYTHILFSTYMLYAVIGMCIVRLESKWKSGGRRNAVYKKWQGFLGMLMYIGTVILFYFSYSPAFITYQEMYILGSCIGIIGVYFIAHALNPLQKHVSELMLCLIQSVSNSTDIVYYVHVFVMMFLSLMIRPELLFFAQWAGIMSVWVVISIFSGMKNKKKMYRESQSAGR